MALNTLSHLLFPSAAHPPHLSTMVLPLYLKITEASWFSWNAKLVVDVIAVIYKQGRFPEAETLIEEIRKKLGVQNKRDLCNFYCYLIDSTAKHQSKRRVVSSCTRLRQLIARSSSVYVKKRAYESMIGGLCEIGMLCEAEDLVGEMKALGLKPSEDLVGEMNTYNYELNSCPTIMSMLQDHKNKTIPLSVKGLLGYLSPDEANLVMEFVASSSVVDGLMGWNSLELKLDLHELHSSSSFLIFLQWIDELQLRFYSGEVRVPAEITLICGSRKQSSTRGVSRPKLGFFGSFFLLRNLEF